MAPSCLWQNLGGGRGCPTSAGIRWLLCKSIATCFKPTYGKKKKIRPQDDPTGSFANYAFFTESAFWVISDADKNHIFLTSVRALPQIFHYFPLLATLKKKDRGHCALTNVTKNTRRGPSQAPPVCLLYMFGPRVQVSPGWGLRRGRNIVRSFWDSQDFVFLDIWVARRQDILPNILQLCDPPCYLKHCRS